jgi:hypothetical protein
MMPVGPARTRRPTRRAAIGPDDLLSGIQTFLEESQTAELGLVFQPFIERVRWVLGND